MAQDHPLDALHGEINSFGWLTMMIYGMIYAVLALSTWYRLARAVVGWACAKESYSSCPL